MSIALRDYQQKAIDLLAASVKSNHRAPLLVVSTGSGKTRTAAAICERAVEKGNRVLFITPRRGLTFQAASDFSELGIESGIIMAGVEHDPSHMVEVASMDTIISRINQDRITRALRGVEAADIIIVDEAHLSVSDKRKTFLNDVKSNKYGDKKLVIGLTASPCVNGGGGLGGVYDDLLVPIQMQELIDKGYLCQPKYFAAKKPEIEGSGSGEYKKDDLEKAYDPIVGDVLKNWKRIAENTITVIFTPTRATAAHLTDVFNANGYPSEYVDANTKDDDRQEMFDRLGSGKTKIIANVGIVGLGIDIPTIQTVVMATATKSVARWMQAVGRAMRISEGKDNALIIDHGGMCLNQNMGAVESITEWDLAEKGKVQDRILQRRKDKKEPKEIVCVKCKTIFTARRDCPSCGHVMKQKTEKLEYYEADLKEIEAKKMRNLDHSGKQKLWNDCLYIAKYRNMKIGAAAHMYKQKTGVFPRGLETMPKGMQWKMTAKDFLASLH